MKNPLVYLGIIAAVLLVILLFRPQPEAESPLPPPVMETLNITSPAFTANSPIPESYTCDGENVSPPLAFSGIPAETKSLALIMDDPDAPRGTWVHWTVWNIDPKKTEIEENVRGLGTEGVTSFGETGYGGPCPPSGTHRYFFKVYALDTPLTLKETATKEQIEQAMAGHVLAKGELIGLYSRKK